jgi:glycosyltransferase involved in cell wall biosynthesis
MMPKINVKLSAAIITFNEEANIKDCIDSLIDIVDEVVVVDSYSTDKTKEICSSYSKVKFFENTFHGHVQQKNHAINICEGKWILSLDADECLTPDLKRSIAVFLKSEKIEEYVGVKFPRLTYHIGKPIRHSGWYPNARYRLFKKGFAHWGGENPHDKIILNGKGCMLKGDLIHYSFVDISDHVRTINAFSSIAAYVRFGKGREFYIWRLLLKPIIKFIELYLIKRGFLDGMAGYIISVSSAYSTFLKEAKLYELDKLGVDAPSNLSKNYRKK